MVGFLRINHVQKIFKATDDAHTEIEALHQINTDIEPGEFISLVGPSGSGKTTLLRIIAGLEKASQGEVWLDDQIISQPSRKLGFVFQEATLYPWLTVYDNIALGLKLNKKKERLAEVKDYINLVGLSGFEKAYPHNLSGGMQQRVNIARALINNPDVLLLDEPFGALDAFTRSKMQAELIDIWQKRQITMIMVTHDVEEAVFLSDRVFAMTPRPAVIKESIAVDLKRPRERDSQNFIAIKEKILHILNF